MGIKLKSRDPKSTDFASGDIVINTKDGTLFYKSTKGLFKIQGDNISTPLIESNIPNVFGSGSDFFVNSNMIISGSIVPYGSGSHDLGSPARPWRDLHIMTSSVKFYDNQGEIGKISYDRDKGLQLRDNIGNITTDFSASAIKAITIISAPQGRFNGITGSLDGGFF